MNQVEHNSFDVIVVGTGPGGATVARELSRRGRRVLMIEWGRNLPIRGTIGQMISYLLIPGRSLLLTSELLALGRGIIAGGSSIAAYATAFDPPIEKFRSFGVDLSAELREARQELPIAPLADRLIGPAVERIMTSAKRLGYQWKKLDKIVHQDKCLPCCDKCTMGCPHGAKWSARHYIADAVSSGAELLTGAKVKRVMLENKKACGVEYTKKYKTGRAFAPTIVVSAGGIGSPLILRASGISGAGRDFFFDPLIAVMGEVKDIKGGKEFPMTSGVHLEDEGYLMTDLGWPRWIYQLFTAEVMRTDRLFAQSRSLQIMIKVKDSLGGSLTSHGFLKKRLPEAEKEKFRSGYNRAKEILRQAGAANIFKTWYIATHPGGTVKIGELVDSNLKTEYDNLYVCDCSVIPFAWGLPPTLSLVCLGKRLVKHLSEKAK
jgi:choline dehydrogenase-like flavoprotein